MPIFLLVSRVCVCVCVCDLEDMYFDRRDRVLFLGNICESLYDIRKTTDRHTTPPLFLRERIGDRGRVRVRTDKVDR